MILPLEICWSRCIVCFACPALCCGHDDVADRVFHIIVAVEVLGMEMGKRFLFLPPGVSSALFLSFVLELSSLRITWVANLQQY